MKNSKQQNESMISLPKSLWKFYWQYAIKNYKFLLVCWMFSVMVVASNGAVWPCIERWTAALFENPVIPAGTTFVMYALPTIALIVGLNMFMTANNTIAETLSSHTSPAIRNQVSEVLTTYVHQQSMGFWINRMSGSIHTQIGYIENQMDAFTMIWRSFCRLMIVFTNGWMLFNVNKYVAILFIFALIFRVIFVWVMRTKVKNASEEASGARSSLNGKLIDSFVNYNIVKLFAGAKKEKEALKEPRRKMVKSIMYSRYVMRLFWAIPGLLWDMLMGATILFCCILFQRGEILLSEVIYTMSVFYTVMGTVGAIIDVLPDIIDKTASANKAYRELVVPVEIRDNDNAKPLVVNSGLIEFKNVYFKYRNKYVLKDLNLTIKPGERVGIVGASGAGKTTLVNLLMRFYEPQKGFISIDGQKINEVRQDSLRENISFIPQEPTMFNRTLAENIAYGKFGATKEEIRKAAKFASADKFIMDTEKKYDSIVGDKGIKLSGGQRQRVAIARAFLKNAPILVLDEATSALDSETEIAIQKSFDKLSKGRTTIAIAHRLSTLRNMDRIIVLDEGEVVEQGTHTALLRKKGVYHHLWQMQSGGFLQEKKR